MNGLFCGEPTLLSSLFEITYDGGVSRSAPTSRRGSLTDKSEEIDCGGLLMKVRDGVVGSNGSVTPALMHLEEIQERLKCILARLEEDRKAKSRPSDYSRMSVEQIFQEKLEIQRLLIDYESEFGHPDTPEEKAAMKEIYDRYRVIKRLARRSSSARSRETGIELVTIPEEEALSLTLASPAHRLDIVARNSIHSPNLSSTEANNPTSSSKGKLSMCTPASCFPSSRHKMDLPNFHRSADSSPSAQISCSAGGAILNENLRRCETVRRCLEECKSEKQQRHHSNEEEIDDASPSESPRHVMCHGDRLTTCHGDTEVSQEMNQTTVSYHAMSRQELLQTQRKIQEEKKVARRSIVEFEEKFKTQTGRKVTKEDRGDMIRTYKNYKICKSKLKLITALLSKMDSKENLMC